MSRRKKETATEKATKTVAKTAAKTVAKTAAKKTVAKKAATAAKTGAKAAVATTAVKRAAKKRTPVADKNGVAYAAINLGNGDEPLSAGLPVWEMRAFEGTEQRDGWVGVDPENRIALTVPAAKKLDGDGVEAIGDEGLEAWKTEWWHDDYYPED